MSRCIRWIGVASVWLSFGCGTAATAPSPAAAIVVYADQSYQLDGRAAFILEPTTPRADHAWIWLAPSHLPDTETGMQYVTHFLDQGFAIAGIDVAVSCGSPAGATIFDDFYRNVVSRGHSEGARILGMSNGGLQAYAWAFRHPERVALIGGIYPATDLRSWPGLSLAITLPDPGLGFNLSQAELTTRLSEFNPISNLAPLAAAGVPIYHFAGDRDDVVSVEANSRALVDEYHRLSGTATLEIRAGLGHYAYGFYSDGLAAFMTSNVVRR